jgi:hypothetical protein
MSEPIEIERDEEMLGQLAELDLALAKLVYSRAAAAEDAGEMADLGRTYQRLARSLRQTIALRDRLRRARRQEARANPPPKPPRDPVRIARRKVELREAVRRVIFTETEGEQQDYLWTSTSPASAPSWTCRWRPPPAGASCRTSSMATRRRWRPRPPPRRRRRPNARPPRPSGAARPDPGLATDHPRRDHPLDGEVTQQGSPAPARGHGFARPGGRPAPPAR